MGLFNLFKKKEGMPSLSVPDDAIVAMADGQMIDVANVSDPVFAEKMMGESTAFVYNTDKAVICSPANGTLSVLFPGGHAFGVTMHNGTELMVHIGINTVEANGEGFKLLGKKQGDTVHAGEPIVEADLKKLGEKYELPVMLIVTNSDSHKVQFVAPCNVKAGQKVNL